MSKIVKINGLIQRMAGEIKKVLPRHISPDRLCRVFLTSFRKNPILLQCDEKSILGALMFLAEVGLEPDNILGYAHLIPYKNKGKLECQVIIGYRGLIELARRSGQVVSINAHIIYENDDYEIKFGLNPDIRHIPKIDGDRGKKIGVYAIAILKDGQKHFEFLTRQEVEKIKKQALAKIKNTAMSPWTTHEDEMWKKTAIRRLAKYLPLSPEFTRIAVRDEYIEAGVDISEDVVIPEEEVEEVKEEAEKKQAEAEPEKTEEKQEPEDENTIGSVKEALESQEINRLLEFYGITTKKQKETVLKSIMASGIVNTEATILAKIKSKYEEV